MNKTDIDNKLTSFNRRITSNETKHLEFQKKLNSPITNYYNFFSGRIYFTSNDGSQNIFLSTNTCCTDYSLTWKSKGVFNSQFEPSCTALLHSITRSEYRIRIKFDKDALAVEQNNYLTKIGNFYIPYDLDPGSRNPTYNFNFKNCLFEATNIVKNTDKEKYVYSEYEITFGSAGSWSFSNDFA